MLGPLEDALAEPDADAAAGDRELLEVVHRNALRLLKLVNTLLDFSRIEAGPRRRPSYEPTDLAALTADLASVFRSAVERPGCGSTSTARRSPEPVYVDRDMWEKIVLNLLSNAFKFTFEGEIARRAARRGRQRRCCAVRDTGTGIPATELPHLFERFHRVAGRRAAAPTRARASAWRWSRSWSSCTAARSASESVYGAGSTFTVAIPLGTAHLPADRVGARRARCASDRPSAPAPSSRRRCAGCRAPDAEREDAARSRRAPARAPRPPRPAAGPHPARRRQRRHARATSRRLLAARLSRSMPSPTASRRCAAACRAAARPGAHRRDDAAAGRLRAAARRCAADPRTARHPGHHALGAGRRGGARRGARRPAPTTTWSSRSAPASCWPASAAPSSWPAPRGPPREATATGARQLALRRPTSVARRASPDVLRRTSRRGLPHSTYAQRRRPSGLGVTRRGLTGARTSCMLEVSPGDSAARSGRDADIVTAGRARTERVRGHASSTVSTRPTCDTLAIASSARSRHPARTGRAAVGSS